MPEIVQTQVEKLRSSFIGKEITQACDCLDHYNKFILVIDDLGVFTFLSNTGATATITELVTVPAPSFIDEYISQIKTMKLVTIPTPSFRDEYISQIKLLLTIICYFLSIK